MAADNTHVPDVPGPDHRAEPASKRNLDGVLTPERRRALYLVAVALFGVLGVYGVVDDSQAGPWLELVAAILGLGVGGLAAANTPTSK